MRCSSASTTRMCWARGGTWTPISFSTAPQNPRFSEIAAT